jgi:hypothetical protein
LPSLLKRIRQRFGISAPKMTVRTHVAWYWRWLGMVVFASVTLAVAAWMYDAGRRFAGFDSSEVQEELAALRSKVMQLQTEADQLRSVANASGARLQIEQSAQAQIGSQVKQLEAENIRLKEDLAFFEGLMPSEKRDEPLSIHRLKVEPGTLSGEYRYRLLVMHGGKRDREFHGSLQITVDLQDKGRNDMIVATGGDTAENGMRKLNFKFFRRVEGTFRVPPTAKVRAVQFKVFESGSSEPRITQSVKLS